jgi:hypothetical protein
MLRSGHVHRRQFCVLGLGPGEWKLSSPRSVWEPMEPNGVRVGTRIKNVLLGSLDSTRLIEQSGGGPAGLFLFFTFW